MEHLSNRAIILERALELFAQRGYDAVGVQEIAEASRITKPTLYHYFGNKLGLLEALLSERFTRLYLQVEEAARYQGDLPQNIERLISVYFDFARQEPVFYRLQLALVFAPPGSEASKIVARLNERHYQIIEELFAQASRDHGNMRGRQKAYAVTFIGMINNYITLYLNGYTALDDALIYQAGRQFMYGIFS